MQPTDQPEHIQTIDSTYVDAAELSAICAWTHPPQGVRQPGHHRSVSIRDTRFPSGRVYVVAWDVICQGNSDLSTMLCRSDRW